MKVLLVAALIFAVVGLLVISMTPASAGSLNHAGASAAGTCTTKHCPPNTHCCYSCSGSPICLKNGAPCPECAPQ